MELVEQSKAPQWPHDKPTQQAFDENSDKLRKDVDNMILTWAEVQQKYQEIQHCTTEVIWVYWQKIMTPILPNKEEEDWEILDFLRPEAAASSSEPTGGVTRTNSVTLVANHNTPRLSRSARSETSSHATDRSTSADRVALRREPMTDRPPAEKVERPTSCPPPWKPANFEQEDPEGTVTRAQAGEDHRDWKFWLATGWLKHD